MDVDRVIATLRSKRISHRTIASIAGSLTNTPFGRVRYRLGKLHQQELWQNVGMNGPVAQVLKLPTLSGGVMDWTCASIPALMARMVAESPPYADMIETTTRGNSVAKPFRLVVYSDEVTPGNVLAPDNRRKFHAFYINFLEAGEHLNNVQSWLIGGAMLSTEADQVEGGLSCVTKMLLESAFGGSRCLRWGGVSLNFGSGILRTVYFELHAVIADADALRAMFGYKGAAGLKPCFKCINCVSAGHGLDGDDTHVSHGCPHLTAFALASDEDVYRASDIVSFAAEQSRSQSELDQVEKALGLNFVPEGILQSRQLRGHLKPCSGTRYDPMHCFLCNGVVALEIKCFMKVMQVEVGVGFPHLNDFCRKEWRFPQSRANKVSNLFTSKKISDKGKPRLQASEIIAALPVLLYFVEVIMEAAPENKRIQAAAASFVAMVQATKSYIAAKRGLGVTRHAMESTTGTHLEAWNLAYGEPDSQAPKPKQHYALHIGEQLESDGRILDCFVLERKHLEPKAYAENSKSLRGFDAYVLLTSTNDQLAHLQDPSCFATTCLEGKIVSSPTMASILGVPSAEVAEGARYRGMRVASGDYAILSNGAVAYVEFAARVAHGLSAAIFVAVSPCEFVHKLSPSATVWQRQRSPPEIVPIVEVLEPLTWKSCGYPNQSVVVLAGFKPP